MSSTRSPAGSMQRIGSHSQFSLLPSFNHVLRDLVEAEHAEGWLARCIAGGKFLALNDRLVVALKEVLAPIIDGPVLEVCAGNGALALALSRAGIQTLATDISPPPEPENGVERLSAAEALQRYRPRVVIGSHVPVDAGVHEQILRDPDVSHYLLLTAALAGSAGGPFPQGVPGWRIGFREDVARWMISRHDYYLDDRRPIVSHGEAWLFERCPTPVGGFQP